jgi:hypothetical protein
LGLFLACFLWALQPSSVAATFGSTPAGQTPAFHFSSFQSAQQGSSLFSNTPSPAFNQQIGFGQQQPTQNLMMATSTVTTSPSMPQMLIGQSAVAGPPVQCAISSMPVCDFKILSITHGTCQVVFWFLLHLLSVVILCRLVQNGLDVANVSVRGLLISTVEGEIP